MLRWVVLIIVIAAVAAGGLFVAAGWSAPPSIAIAQPDKLVGRASVLDLTVGAPGGTLDSLTVALEQNGQRFPLFELNGSPDGAQGAIVQTDADHVRITRPFGKATIPALQAGAASIA